MDETIAPQGAPANTQPDAAAESIMIPKARFDEVNERRKSAEAELQNLLGEKQAREEAEAAKRGEFESVLEKYKTELSAAKEKASQWDQYQTDRREALISKLSDDDKGLADGLSLGKLEQLVARLENNTQKPGVSTQKPGASVQMSESELREKLKDPQWRKDNWGLVSNLPG